MFERIVLHAGLPKTGSTAIQEALLSNIQELASRGFAVPVEAAFHTRSMDGTESIDHGSLLVWNNLARQPAPIQRLYATNPRAPQAADLLAELDRLSSSCMFQTAIISAEQLAEASSGTLRSIARELRSRAEKVDVCLYVRRPDRAYMAHVSQALKVAARWRPPLQFRLGIREATLRMEKHFGRESVFVFPYHDGVDGWDVVQDFTSHHLGVGLHGRRLNASLSVEAMLLLHSYQRLADIRLEHMRRRYELIVPWLEANDSRFPHRTRAALRPECAAQLIAANQSDLEWLRDRGVELGDVPAGRTSRSRVKRIGLDAIFSNVPSPQRQAGYLEWVVDGLLEACVVMNEMLSDQDTLGTR